MKPLVWLGSSLDEVRQFPEASRREAGFELRLVQGGREPSDWKPMPAVGASVNEIRIHGGNEYRVIYVAKFAEAIYVLHVFMKKTRRTSKADIELARARLKQLMASRRKFT